MRLKSAFAAAALLALVGMLALVLAGPEMKRAAAAAPAGAWQEISWPFLMDQWGKGKAFRCKADQCGADVTLYIRAKIGFCNCATGVADDEELERVADVSLLDERFSALGDGRPIKVGHMAGRSRPYVVARASHEKALAIAFNERCDVIVATAVVTGDAPTKAEPAVLDFLNGDTVMRWAEAALGL